MEHQWCLWWHVNLHEHFIVYTYSIDIKQNYNFFFILLDIQSTSPLNYIYILLILEQINWSKIHHKLRVRPPLGVNVFHPEI